MYMTYMNSDNCDSSRNGNPTADDPDGAMTTTTIVSSGPASTIYGSSGGGGNSSSTTTTMPSSPETNSYDPSTTSMVMSKTTSSVPLTSTENSVSPLMVEEEQNEMLLSATSFVDCRPTSHHRNHHARNDSYQCAGFTALIQAATSQLEYLAEIASSEYTTTQTDDDRNVNISHSDMDSMVSAVHPKQSRRASFKTTPSSRNYHPATTASTSMITMSSATTATSLPIWNDSLPEQLMKLLLSSSSSFCSSDTKASSNPNEYSDMISFLPNGKYFVIRTSVLTQYLQKTDHSLFNYDDPKKNDDDEDALPEKETEDVTGYEVNDENHQQDDVTTDPPTNRRTTTKTEVVLTPGNEAENESIKTDAWTSHSPPSDRPQSQAVYSRPRRKTPVRRTRIRTLHEFVYTLLHGYNFTWIDHRYLQLFSNPLSSTSIATSRRTDDEHGEKITVTQPQSPELQPLLSASTSYPEVMVFRHVNFIEDNCSLCQQIAYCGDSQSSPSSQAQASSQSQGPKEDPSSQITTTKLHQHHKNYYKRHDQQHSKVVHNHHAVVLAQQQQRSLSTSSPKKSNDPSTATGANATITNDETPSSPIVVGSSATITKRRLSPGFLRQQEQKNGVTTSKQKVKIDISDVTNSVPILLAPVTDESTRTSFRVDAECLDSTTATMSTATAAGAVDGASMDNEERKLSSGCESDMTTTTTQTKLSFVTSTTTDGRSEMSDFQQEDTNDTTESVSSSIVIPHPIGVMEETTAKMIRNIAISIANERLQLPIPAATTAATAYTKSTNDSEKNTKCIPQHEIDNETTKSSLSELIELGISTCTKEIVISAVESLLHHRSHSHDVYKQNLQELSTSSLPNLIPICKHIFENHQYRNNTATMDDDQGIDSRGPAVPSLATSSAVAAKTVTPETISTNGGCTEASASSLIRVITTGSDAVHTNNQHHHQCNDDNDPNNQAGKISPRNLNDDSITEISLPPQQKQERRLSTARVGTRRSSAKGTTTTGTADSN